MTLRQARQVKTSHSYFSMSKGIRVGDGESEDGPMQTERRAFRVHLPGLESDKSQRTGPRLTVAPGRGAGIGGGSMALELPQNFLLHGIEETPTSPQWLTAGPLTAGLEVGQLRGIYLGGNEIVRRVYGAVRDRFWNTVPGVMRDFVLEQSPRGFRVAFTSEHVSAEVDFLWRAEITGGTDGTLRYAFDGEARREMYKNRIGLCVLLPIALAGESCSVEYVSGDRAEVKFPQLVDPMQPVRGLHDFREVRYAAGDGVELIVQFEGDMFEIEDQRNWTDASFKTYSTPQRIPMPAKMASGQRVRQVVTLRLWGKTDAMPAAVPPVDEETVQIACGEAIGELPGLGVGMAYHGGALTEKEMARLKALGLSHYRVEADPSRPEWQEALERGLQEADAMGAKAEVVLLVFEEVETMAQAAADVAADFPGIVVRWLVLSRGVPASRGRDLKDARDILTAGGGAVGGGTDADFFQINNNRPPEGVMDFVSVPLRPCAHQFDRTTLAQNLEGQREVLKTMAELWPGMPLAVSPVSFRTRAQKGRAAAPGELPAQADVRQMSLLGAAWTVGCIKAVAESGAQSLTLFQTTGLRGIMERESGSAAPREFHSVPGGVFPVYIVLAALTGWRGAKVVEAVSGAPHNAEALVLEKEGRRRALLANYTPQPRRVVLQRDGVPLFAVAQAVVLEARNALAAMSDPEGFLAAPPRQSVTDGAVLLPAFAVAWVDC